MKNPTDSLRLENQFSKAAIDPEEAKRKTEFERYEQDCRKRALELAHIEAGRTVYEPLGNPLSQAQRITPNINVLELADKYYNWLISLPNDK